MWRAAYYRGTKYYAASVTQRTQYYPSGLPWSESLNPDAQKRKYNGKEFVETNGYDMYDYEARGMYPAIMRFTTVDPLAENYPCWSHYVYCMNNPVRMIDPTGMAATDTINGGNLPQLVVTGKATSSGVITYYPDNRSVFEFYQMPQLERQMTISHLPLPGGSWKVCGNL